MGKIRIALYLLAACLLLRPETLRAQPSAWQEFPVAQSRVTWPGIAGMGTPLKAWEWFANPPSKNTREFQYLWSGGKAAPLGHMLLVTLKDSNSFFSTAPTWQEMTLFEAITKLKADRADTTAGTAPTAGLGVLSWRRFAAGPRSCFAFGGLTNSGQTSQLLGGLAASSGDTSVRGYYCGPEGQVLQPDDIKAAMARLSYK